MVCVVSSLAAAADPFKVWFSNIGAMLYEDDLFLRDSSGLPGFCKALTHRTLFNTLIAPGSALFGLFS